jgi:hypothetical protein
VLPLLETAKKEVTTKKGKTRRGEESTSLFMAAKRHQKALKSRFFSWIFAPLGGNARLFRFVIFVSSVV